MSRRLGISPLVRQMVRSSFRHETICPALLVSALAILFALPVPASANAPIVKYFAEPASTQAGGHPDLSIYFEVKNRLTQQSQSACNCEDAKDAIVHLPAGFIGNPHATPQCSIADFSADECPVDSQVGMVEVQTSFLPFLSAVYNVVPPPEVAGWLAFKVFLFDTPQFTVLSSRTGSDYGLNATATSIYHGLSVPLKSYWEDLWGVPAAHVHDPLRLVTSENSQGETSSYSAEFCDANGAHSTENPESINKPCLFKIPPAASNSPETPFLQSPTNCDSPLSTTLEVIAYDKGTSEASDPWPKMTGCDQLGFNPSLDAKPTTTETDTPSGIDVNLEVPQEQSPTIPSPSELRGATVTLPPGFSINPNAADGKLACGDIEAGFGTEEEAQCPEFSKVGSLTIDSSALPGPLPGYVYLGQPLPGYRYRIFLVANGFATHIKLPGTVTANAVTGQLTINFQNLPQSPLTAFDMHFFGSERGLLATPTQCGTYPVTTTFTPWATSLGTQTSTQLFTLDSGPGGTECPGADRPFNPGFQAASAGNTAGAHTNFALEFTRKDGDQNLRNLRITTPPGFSATLSGIPYCTDAELESAAQLSHSGVEEELHPSCPVESQIGTSVAGAGAGTHPVYLTGKVYLAGPYKGAPLSLAVITPAVSGPYDLGNVVVRAAINLNPETAQITTTSDPLPQIVEGIPLRLRMVRVNLNRPHFALNPTNCNPLQINAETTGDQGAVARMSEPFQMANCAALSFAPRLAMRLTGGTTRSQNPALETTLTANPGEANISRAEVTLPKGMLVDNAHLQTPCTRVQFAESKCPSGSVIGTARAQTPLLEKPLEGPVYLRTNPENKSGLPDIVAALNGQIDIALDGKISTVRERLRTTFNTVPDAPVRTFNLKLDGGSRGLLQNSTNICRRNLKAEVTLDGQNGAVENRTQLLQAPCHKVRPKRHSRRRSGHSTSSDTRR